MNAVKEMPQILLADPDARFTERSCRALEHHGARAIHTTNAADCIETVRAVSSLELVLLEYNLPDMSGCELCSTLRGHYELTCPILFVSDSTAPQDVIRGLSSGADNYFFKPLEGSELSARVLAQLRMTSRMESTPPAMVFDQLRLDPHLQCAELDGCPLTLTRREFLLLAYFCRHPYEVLSRETLFHDVWESRYGDLSTVTVTVKKLRDKLGNEHNYIKTVWGVGYIFSPPKTEPCL